MYVYLIQCLGSAPLKDDGKESLVSQDGVAVPGALEKLRACNQIA